MKYLNLMILCLLFSLSMGAMEQDSLYLEGKVFDKLTHVQLPGSLVEVLDGVDSTVINHQVARQVIISGGERYVESGYNILIPRKTGKYILRVSMSGYDTAYMDLPINKIHNRAWKQEVSPVYLARIKSVNLDDVVVKATKVQFYHKGDTLVYNADAFQLAEGSMLDALIRQLPGAEIRKNGQIYVNGKFVENLLLNGKDFFKGDNTVMLENLPNYMVSTINVYDKLGDDSKFVGHEMAGDKQYVMDVKLKRQYSIGWVGNLEGGLGTKDRYLGRLFAMRFTDHSRVAVYGNTNNLNDTRKPGENDSWKPSDLTGGLVNQQFGGIDYSIDARSGKYKLNGNVQAKHRDTNSVTHTNRKNFLPEGDTFDRMVNSNRNHELSLHTDHRLYFKGKNASLELNPRVDYRKYTGKTNYSALTVSQDFSNFGKAQMDSLYTGSLGKGILMSAINRNLQREMLEGHSLETFLSGKSIVKFKNSPDNLTLYAAATYRDAAERRFDNNLVEYYGQGTRTSTDFRNRYFDNVPNHGYHLTGKATYTYQSGKWYTLYLSYKYDRDYKSGHSTLYRLDRLDGWGEESQHELGQLPSMEAYRNTIDPHNSYRSREYDDAHTVEPFLNWELKGKGGTWSGQMVLPVSFQSRTLHYQRSEVDTTFTKRTTLLNVYSTFARWTSKDRCKKFTLWYGLDSKAPDMNMYLNVHDTTDPLNITLGNSNLKNTYRHEVTTSYSHMLPQKQVMLGIQARYKVSTNEISMGYTYDKSTGVRTFRPDNVNGNWQGGFQLACRTPVNKKKTLVLTTILEPEYRHHVDLVGLDGNSASRSVVENMGLSERIDLQWRLGKSSLALKSTGTWGRTTSSRVGFESFNALDLSNGVVAQVSLPWKLQLGTDVTLYSRRGYASREMNTDDLVWNARLSRSFFKGNVLLVVDGFDILGQLSNVTRVMNAQAITETYSNVIPRYVMFHAVYKFRKMPKKK